MFSRNSVNPFQKKDNYARRVKGVFMSVKVLPLELTLPYFTVNALAFIPSPDKEVRCEYAVFTHGYTSHKGDCLNWATRLVDAGVPTIIFDHPGHFLGSFHDLKNFKDFKEHAHELFGEAFKRLEVLVDQTLGVGSHPLCRNVILGGHSLGAFTSLKALELPAFKNFGRISIGIGLGLGQRQETHIFETAFYEKTIAIRSQLVSPVLNSKIVFPWLKEAKEGLTISNERIHLITGEDDVVVGPGGVEAFIEVLEKNGNTATFERPKRLAHHEPGAAAPHLYSFLKNHFGWKS